ncbi:D-apionate lactonase [Paraburkholderia sp. MM5477-R1]|uniref:D-apionate lactonase n=1 Tax=Paraburkholderia sp. MM5477-R1 TaxID=2991062 RepID=UPI003D240E08
MNAGLAKLYYGTTQAVPPARRLSVGAWSASLADGALRDIRFGDIEVIRAVAFLVRDKDWGTCRPVLSGVEIDETSEGFRVAYRARCENPDGDVLSYALSISCTAAGPLTLRANLTAHSTFLTARSGFCVLHPIEDVAGAPARVEHGDGTIECASFPALIDPWQPFRNIRSIEHDLAVGLSVRCAFTGDVFEMEDQRNWSDASFKTYSRPLEWPWPYTLDAGESLEQSVTLSVVQKTPGALRRADACAAKTILIDVSEGAETMPALGVAITVDEVEGAHAHAVLLHELAPRQLTFSFDPTAGHGLHELQRFAALQRQSATDAVLEYALPGVETPRAELQMLARQIESAQLALTGVIVSPAVHRQSNPPGSISPPCPSLDEVYREARLALPALRIGGGVLSYFTELNRKRPPLELVDWVTHATCPIVHAADDLSVMQTLEAIPHITRSCRALIGARPYAIGPISIGMRQNPYGSRVMPNPDAERIAMAGADPRQQALFGAAWLVGYAAALAEAGLDTFTLGALTGPRGLAEEGSGGAVSRYPAFHVARALADMGGLDRLRVAVGDSREIACVAARDAGGAIRLLAANLTDATRSVRFAWNGPAPGAGDAAMLDECSVGAAAGAAALDGKPLDVARPVTLRPYVVVIARFESGAVL